jgi:hypothetical protein
MEDQLQCDLGYLVASQPLPAEVRDVSPEVLVAIVTGVVGLISAAALALVNSAITARAGIDEDLRAKRFAAYPKLWSATGAASRWPRSTVTKQSLEELHEKLRSWYYGDGGVFLSATARERYGDVQRLIGPILARPGDPSDELAEGRYTDLMDSASALRTALTEDLDTRRRRSFWEKRRRRRWHKRAGRAADERIMRVGEVEAAARTWVATPDAGGRGSHPHRSGNLQIGFERDWPPG